MQCNFVLTARPTNINFKLYAFGSRFCKWKTLEQHISMSLIIIINVRRRRRGSMPLPPVYIYIYSERVFISPLESHSSDHGVVSVDFSSSRLLTNEKKNIEKTTTILCTQNFCTDSRNAYYTATCTREKARRGSRGGTRSIWPINFFRTKTREPNKRFTTPVKFRRGRREGGAHVARKQLTFQLIEQPNYYLRQV